MNILLSSPSIIENPVIQFVIGIGAVCAAINSIWVAVKIVKEIRIMAGKTNTTQNEEIAALRSLYEELHTTVNIRHEKYMRYFDNDRKEIEILKLGTEVTQKALIALLGNGINGNNKEEMQEAQKALINLMAHQNHSSLL
jgi:hypothetical protein